MDFRLPEMGLGDKRVGSGCPPYQTGVAHNRPRVPIAQNKTGRGLLPTRFALSGCLGCGRTRLRRITLNLRPVGWALVAHAV